MARLPPKNAHVPINKVERLYFPLKGDPSFQAQGGKKHFNDMFHSPTPYASFVERPADVRYSNYRQNNGFTPRQLYRQQNHQKDNYSLFNKYPDSHKETLDQQVYSFKIGSQKTKYQRNPGPYNDLKRQFKIQPLYREQFEEKDKTFYNNAKRRVNTESFNNKNPKTEQIYPERNDKIQKPSCLKIKTQLNEPGAQKVYLKPARFSPTFLSSINY